MKKLLPSAFAACLFVLVLSAKWATFERYGSAMPDWDQWDAEAVETLIPWFTNDDFLTHLLRPHNEHRVVLTKLQTLALVLLNGQWDARLEAVSNAALHAALAAAFWLLAVRVLSVGQNRDQRIAGGGHLAADGSGPSTRDPRLTTRTFLPPALFVLIWILFGLPLAWQNVLGGFHSQQYWLVGLSCAAIVTLPFARSWSAAWWVGAVSSFLALGSMGSGLLAAVAVTIVITFRLFRRETTPRAAWPAFVVASAVVALGVLTRQEVQWHAEMKAATMRDFVFTIVHSLQWPWRDQHWAAAVLWMPWIVLVGQTVRAPRPPGTSSAVTRAIETILALGGWVLLQLAATAYARGAGADYPASRYMDTLIVGTLANALALAWLLTHRPSSIAPRPPQRSSASNHSLFGGGPLIALTAVWLAILGVGTYRYVTSTVTWDLQGAKDYYVKAESNLRRYLATNDPKHLASPDIPFPNIDGLIERISHPSIHALMPAPLRTPLKIVPAAASSPSVASLPSFVANNAIGASVELEQAPRAGLSPHAPPLDYTITWGSHAAAAGPAFTGSWRSAPLGAPLGGWLKFETVGDLARPGADVSLQLFDAETGTHLADVRPSRIPGNSWRSAYVRAPRQPFVIAANDASATHWFAFSPPVEMGAFSFYAWQATKHAPLIFYSALGVTLCLALLALRERRHPGAGFPIASESSRAVV